MKKILVTLMLLLPFMGIMAQDTRWTASTSAEYDGETVLYLQVVDANHNDMWLSEPYQIAAFIDGECRAEATQYYSEYDETGVSTNFEKQFFRLRVEGSRSGDKNKTITVKFYNYMGDQFVYKFANTFTFDEETHGSPSAPEQVVLLPVKMREGIYVGGLNEEGNLMISLNQTIDLKERISLNYGTDGMESTPTNTYSPIDTDETPIEYEFIQDNQRLLNLNGSNLTGVQTSENRWDYEMIRITVEGHPSIETYLYVVVWDPVTAISTDLTSLTVYTRDDLTTYFDGHVFFTPANASDQTYYIEEEGAGFDPTGALAGHISDNFAVMSGEATIRLVSNDNPQEKSDDIALTIYDRPTNIQVKDGQLAEVQVAKGDNVLDAIKAIIDVLPLDGEYVDRSITIEPIRQAALWDENNIATKVGEIDVLVTATAQLEPKDQITVHVTVFQPLKNLTATQTDVTVYVGINAFETIFGYINFVPADASNQSMEWLTFIPSDYNVVGRDGIAVESGTTTVTVTSRENPQIQLVFNVTVKKALTFVVPYDFLNLSKYEDTVIDIDVSGDDPFDPSLLELVFDNHPNAGWGAVATAVKADDTGKKWNLRGKYFGQWTMQLKYNGNIMPGTAIGANVPVEYKFNEGWNWLSIPATIYDPQIMTHMAEKTFKLENTPELRSPIYEARTQDGLVINDEQYGFVGDFKEIAMDDQMYKVKATEDGTMYFGDGTPLVMANPEVNVYPGYTWVAYPHEVNHTVATLSSALSEGAHNSDMIIGKDGFAAYTGSNWLVLEGTFNFIAGQGYIYYSKDVEDHELNWGDQTLAPDAAAMPAPSTHRRVWKFNNSRFSDMMPVIATIDGIERMGFYTVGAFVGDECRGFGGCVDGKWMFISVSGEPGETVHFRLHNEITGEYTDLATTVKFGPIPGTIDEPLKLSTTTTGISEVYRNDVEEDFYDLSGRKVNADHKGVTIRRTADGKFHKVLNN